MRMGTEMGKNRKERRSVFPSEYITIAETIDPITARSSTPMVKTIMSPGRRSKLMFKKIFADKIVAKSTVKMIANP